LEDSYHKDCGIDYTEVIQMGYRIDYDMKSGYWEVSQNHKWRLPVLTVFFFILFLFLCSWFWPEGMNLFVDLIIPGDNTVTLQAAKNMTEYLRDGGSIQQAVDAFCREVILGAKILH